MDRERRGSPEIAEEGGIGGGVAGKVTRTERLAGTGPEAGAGDMQFGAMPFLDVMAMGGGLPAVQRKGAADGSTVVKGGGTHIVKDGETLWEIAKAEYGNGKYWTRLRDANRLQVLNGHLVKVGAELVLPSVEVPTLEAMKQTDWKAGDDELRDLAAGMSDDEYGAFLAGLDQAERDANGQLLQTVELIRSTGRTLDELGEDQLRWLELEASRRRKTPGMVVKERLDGHGHGGAESKKWTEMEKADQLDWERRFHVVIERIRAEAPPDVLAIVEEAEAQRGGFVWEPEGALNIAGFAFTRRDWKIYCGMDFVLAGEEDVTKLWASIAHEMGGHNVYGRSLGTEIIKRSVGGMGSEDAGYARSGRSLGSGYGYVETELFAELYEASYDDESNPTDRPFDVTTYITEGGVVKQDMADVQATLEGIRAAFEPSISIGLIRSVALRVELDGFIRPEVKARFRLYVKTLFGDILPSWSDPAESQS